MLLPQEFDHTELGCRTDYLQTGSSSVQPYLLWLCDFLGSFFRVERATADAGELSESGRLSSRECHQNYPDLIALHWCINAPIFKTAY